MIHHHHFMKHPYQKRFPGFLLIIISLFSLPALSVAQEADFVNVPPASSTHIQKPQPESAENISDNAYAGFCEFASPEKPLYDASFITVHTKEAVHPSELFEVIVYMKNTGNVPWFSVNSGCTTGKTVNLGTARNNDRSSPFYYSSLINDSDWLDSNRIAMYTKRVNPGQIGAFRFTSQAPQQVGLYREYYAPVVEGFAWLESGLFHIDTRVGNPHITTAQEKVFPSVGKSMNLAEVKGDSGKYIEIDLSEQKLRLKTGDTVLQEFRVSTGGRSTPTPVGQYRIQDKKPLRVGIKPPHYHMPKWLGLGRGYGIHELPYTVRKGDVYWREGFRSIGRAISHGCIRLLPNDAEAVYNFGEAGMRVVVKR